MKASHAVALNAWITDNKQWLGGSERGTLIEVAKKASDECGFKVSVSSLSELMRSQGIETRRMSQRQSEKLTHLAEIEKLTAENMELRRTLAKVAASDYVPDDFKDFVFAGLKQEIKAAIIQGTTFAPAS